MQNILEVRNLTKIYPGGILANHNLNFDLKEGEIHALVGENGAGKSTLMKMLYGLEEVTSGDILFKGEKVKFSSPKDAIAKGIGMVQQHFRLVESMTVAENLTLGMEPKKGMFVNRKKAIEETNKLAEQYGFDVEAAMRVKDISIGMKQKLEILKVLYRGARVIILDEPTAILTPQETKELFEQLKNLKKKGFTIIFISHKLDEVKFLTDRLTVLKAGKTIGTYNTDELSVEKISNLMVGRDINLKRTKDKPHVGKTMLKVEDVSYTDRFGVKKLDKVSFEVREGEILGIAGVEGNGQSEIVKIIAGTLKGDSGRIYNNDKEITKMDILSRRETGLAHISEDRMEEGCAVDLSLLDNLICVNNKKFTNKMGLLSTKKSTEYAAECIDNFKVKTKDCYQNIGSLSGGNVQKAVVAREFTTGAKTLLVNQPTRGVDVGSIELIHDKLMHMRDNKAATLLVSADLTELLNLSDRIVVFYKGKVAGQFEDVANVTEEDLGLYMLGIKNDSQESAGGEGSER